MGSRARDPTKIRKQQLQLAIVHQDKCHNTCSTIQTSNDSNELIEFCWPDS